MSDRTMSDRITSNPKIAASAIGFGLCALRAVGCYVDRKMNKYPPGPIGIPFFGSLFSCSDLQKYAEYLASNYGEISMIYIRNQPFVFLHSVELINEVFKHQNALDREWDDSLMMTHLKPAEFATPTAGQKHWAKKRKMFQAVIVSRLDSNFLNTVHNKSLDSHVLGSIDKCIKLKQLWYPSNDLSYIMFHATWNALFGSYIGYDSKHKQCILGAVETLFKDAAIDIIIRYLGIQRVIPSAFTNPFSEHMQHFVSIVETLLYEQLNYDKTIFDYNDTKWEKHFEDILNNNHKNCCVASKFIAMHRNNPSADSSKSAILLEFTTFFTAGIDTSLNTADYGMIVLAKHGKEQEIIYNELKSEFGNGSDGWKMEKIEIRKVIHKLHNLRAFVYEMLRLSSVLPIGVAHYNSKASIKLQNGQYIIPKNSVILSDVVTANKSDPYWFQKTKGKPKNLCLNAWLDENGQFKYNLNKDKMVAFGIGPRDCAGMRMALTSLYILFAKLILNYRFALSEEDTNIEIKQKFDFTSTVQPKIGLKVEKRNYN